MLADRPSLAHVYDSVCIPLSSIFISVSFYGLSFLNVHTLSLPLRSPHTPFSPHFFLTVPRCYPLLSLCPCMGSVLGADSPPGGPTQGQRFPGFKREWSRAGCITRERQLGPWSPTQSDNKQGPRWVTNHLFVGK